MKAHIARQPLPGSGGQAMPLVFSPPRLRKPEPNQKESA